MKCEYVPECRFVKVFSMIRLQNLSGISLVLLCLFYGACTNKEIPRIYSLTFEKEAYEIRSGMTSSVPFRSGNKDYVVTSSDTAVVKVSVSVADSKIGFGTLFLLGNRKGEAIVSVKDNISGERVDLQITVTDFYLGFEVVETDSGIFQKNDYLFFVKNESKDFLVFGETGTTGELALRFKGSYEFTIIGDKPFVNIGYEKEGQPVEYTFDMSGSSPEVFSLFGHFFHLSAAKTKDIGIRYYYMQLKETATNSETVCLLRDQYALPKE